MLRIRAIVLGMLTVATSMAAEGGLLGAGIGAGIVVIGAGLGIGLLAFAAANATARQPEAAAKDGCAGASGARPAESLQSRRAAVRELLGSPSRSAPSALDG